MGVSKISPPQRRPYQADCLGSADEAHSPAPTKISLLSKNETTGPPREVIQQCFRCAEVCLITKFPIQQKIQLKFPIQQNPEGADPDCPIQQCLRCAKVRPAKFPAKISHPAKSRRGRSRLSHPVVSQVRQSQFDNKFSHPAKFPAKISHPAKFPAQK